MDERFVIVLDEGASGGARGGPSIARTQPMSEAAALALIGRIARGEMPDWYRPPAAHEVLRVDDRHYLVLRVGGGRGRPSPTHLTVAELIEPSA